MLVEHADKLGRILAVGDVVAFPDHNNLCIGKVYKINAKMLTISRLGRYNRTCLKYSTDTVRLDGPDVMIYLLKVV
jgi:hypothetical protein